MLALRFVSLSNGLPVYAGGTLTDILDEIMVKLSDRDCCSQMLENFDLCGEVCWNRDGDSVTLAGLTITSWCPLM